MNLSDNVVYVWSDSALMLQHPGLCCYHVSSRSLLNVHTHPAFFFSPPGNQQYLLCSHAAACCRARNIPDINNVWREQLTQPRCLLSLQRLCCWLRSRLVFLPGWHNRTLLSVPVDMQPTLANLHFWLLFVVVLSSRRVALCLVCVFASFGAPQPDFGPQILEGWVFYFSFSCVHTSVFFNDS